MRISFRHWPVALKLAVAFAALIATLAIANILVGQSLSRIDHAADEDIRQGSMVELLATSVCSESLPTVRQHVFRHFYSRTPEEMTEIEADIVSESKLITDALETLDKVVDDPAGQKLVVKASADYAAYRTFVAKMLAFSRKNADDQIRAELPNCARQYKELLADFDAMMDHGRERSATAVADIQHDIATAKTSLQSTAIVGIAVAGVALLLLTLAIALPLRRLSALLDRLGRGEIADDRDLVLDRGDEIGRAVSTAAGVAAYMREMSAAAQAMASGDLRVQVRPRGPADAMGNAFSGMIDKLRASLDVISRGSQALAGASEELSSTATQLDGSARNASERTQAAAAAAEQVNRGIQSVAGAAEEMVSTVKEIARQTQTMSGKVNEASRAAESMAQAARNVDEIAKTIAGIAEQTNLLALNATIEAARAGDQGRGFAVVAGEVKTLALQTATATKDIARILDELRSHAEVVSTGTNEVRDATTAVAGALEEQNATSDEIGRNIGDAAKGSSEIAVSVTAASTAVGEAQQGAAQVREAAGSLSKVAIDLQTTVSTFRF